MATSANPSKTPIKTLSYCENADPNLPIPRTPSQKPTRTPLMKSSSKPKKPISTPARIQSPPPPPPQQQHQQQRKFIVAKKKKNPRNTSEKINDFDPQKAAYEALRASQDNFFKKDCGESKDETEKIEGKGEKSETRDVERMKSLVMEEALRDIPEPGSGRVKHLVKAFENLLSISDENEGEKSERRRFKEIDWALPGLREPLMMKRLESEDGEGGSCRVCSSLEFVRDSRLCSSFDSNGDRLSFGSRTSNGSRRSRRNSLDSSRRSWNKKLKVTSQQPFKLRTEQRGRVKEENFIMKVKEMLTVEEKKRIPIAQGLPWTTDEPECLVKPPVKERTEPIDLVLHSDVRAVERSEFDQYVAERLNFIEQLKLERERQQQLEEEEEIKRLRRELVPKAQPMPYFDRPFVPKKSTRPRTVPKEPRFHARPMKSSCVSLFGR
ncbi:uncharacterized protein A4U43_UnF10910 [Asparagus officinalis]|uniref:TPX2 C-terminal domain-containing protein n=1 Tax=Asparagus officinalis TaxID=4686 RepID=A0A1R3L5E4_ASPOF|nr:protein TPX2-like isoform X2 [Asparagus officinalis]ONK54828.1 uncharacterized protein A4U43_UnF10910 [Asparagus officinalis]